MNLREVKRIKRDPAPGKAPLYGSWDGRPKAIKEPTMATLYRHHRGGLAESMETVRPVRTMDELKAIIREDYPLRIRGALELKIEFYCFDDRINWNTYLVSALIGGQWLPMGMMDRARPGLGIEKNSNIFVGTFV